MVKLVKITKYMKRIYNGRELDLKCYRCGQNFVVGDEAYKSSSSFSARTSHHTKLYCPECCFAVPKK